MKTLREFRIKYNYSYQNMADMLKISKTFYWQLEHKKRRLSYDMAIKIANIFKTTPDKIFYDDIINNNQDSN